MATYWIISRGIVGTSVTTGERIYSSPVKVSPGYPSQGEAEEARKKLLDAEMWEADELDVVKGA